MVGAISCSCSVFLLDRLSHELVAKVFDGGVVDDEVSVGLRPWSFGGIWVGWHRVLYPNPGRDAPPLPAELRDPHTSGPGHRRARGHHWQDPQHQGCLLAPALLPGGGRQHRLPHPQHPLLPHQEREPG